MSKTATVPETYLPEILHISVDMIHPAKDNPRRNLGDLSELVDSIKAMGILQPLVVATQEMLNGYTCVLGHRRLAAAAKAGLTMVPAIARPFTDRERVEAMLVENIQRNDLSPLEEAAAYHQLEDLGASQREIAERVGKSQSHISKRIALLGLAGAVIDKLDSGGITLQDAMAIQALPVEHQAAVFAKDLDPYRRSSIQDKVAMVKRNVEEEEHLAKLREEIKNGGFKEVELEKYGYMPRGVRALGRNYGEVAMKPKEHAKLKCHRVWIRHGALYHGCSDPSSHGELFSRSTSSRGADEAGKAKAAASRDRNKLIRAGQEAKKAAAVGALERTTKRQAEDYILELHLRQEIGPRRYSDESWESQAACKLLGLETGKRKSVTVFREWAAKNGAGPALLVIEIVRMEQLTGDTGRIAGGYVNDSDHERERLGDYYAWLQLHGYTLSEGDRATIKQLKVEVPKPGGPVKAADLVLEAPAGELGMAMFQECPNCGSSLAAGILEAYAETDHPAGMTCPECPRPRKGKAKIEQALADATAGVAG